MTENDQFTETERSNGRRWASEQIHIAGLMNILKAAFITLRIETSVLKLSRSNFVGFGGGVRFVFVFFCVFCFVFVVRVAGILVGVHVLLRGLALLTQRAVLQD